ASIRRRSGIEVALDAEDAREPILVLEAGDVTRSCIEAVVHHLKAQIEVGDRCPYRARADLAQVPVHRDTCSTSRQDQTGVIAIPHLAVGTVEGGLPLGGPEVLETASDAPGLRLVERAIRKDDRVQSRPNRTAGTIVVGQVEAAIDSLADVREHAFTVGALDDGVVVAADHRQVDLQAATERPCRIIMCNQSRARCSTRNCPELMVRAHHLSRTPSLVDAQVGNDVRNLLIAVLPNAGTICETTTSERNGDRRTGDRLATSGRLLKRERSRHAVAELGGVGKHLDAGTCVVRAPDVGLVRISHRVEVEERRRLARREAGKLDERRVGPERRIWRGARTAGDVANAWTAGEAGIDGLAVRLRGRDNEVRTQGAVLGLAAGIERHSRAGTPGLCFALGGAAVYRARLEAGEGTASNEVHFGADEPADLDARIRAGDVIEPCTIQATNLHVLDRLGLYGKIGSLRPSHRNDTRCGAQEKAFHHLHLLTSKICFS